MIRRPLAIVLLIAFALPASAQIKGKPFRAAFEWRKKAVVERHTSLLATFDAQDAVKADYARGDALGGNYAGKLGAQGKWGKALDLTERASITHFRGGPNLNAWHGTIEVWVRGAPGTDIWRDGREHWILALQGYSLGVYPAMRLVKRKDGSLALCHTLKRGFDKARSLVYRPGRLAAKDWHHVLISWDRATGRLWLAVNGRGVTGAIKGGFPKVPFFILWLGSSGHAVDAFAPLGGSLDHLRCSDVTVEELGRSRRHPAVDMKLLARAEDGLRRWYGFMGRVQNGGGFANCYTWPTLLPSPTGSRDYIVARGYVSNDKGHVGPAGCWMIQASEILREPWYQQLGERMGEAYMAAQMKQGCWSVGYLARSSGFVSAYPTYGHTIVKLQDKNQVHPLYMLLYLHRLTGREDYKQAAVRAGEFVYKAQNPNGSWSHTFDLKRNIGVTARGNPQGGEINDWACSDGMDAMILMYHLTRDRKYLTAFKRCADWFLKAQMGAPTYGWSLQYDKDNNPIWARAFEPPSVSMSASFDAYQALREAYWHTGDRKYIRAPIRFFEWMVRERKRTGKYYQFYDAKSGRAICADGRKIYYLDDAKAMARFFKTSVKVSYARPRKYRAEPFLAKLRGYLKSSRPADLRRPAKLQDLVAEQKRVAAKVRAILDQQHKAGVWLRQGQGRLGAGSMVVWTRDLHVRTLLNYVEDARILLGELPNTFRGRYKLLQCAYPKADWYGTPLRTKGQ